MPSFVELSIEDFVFVIFYRYVEVRVMFYHVTCVYMYGKYMRRCLAALGVCFHG